MANVRTNIAATTAAVTNRLVTSTNMLVGAYSLANTSAVWAGGFTITATITAVTGNDTAGTLVVVGTNLAGQAVTETITLTNGVGGSGTQIFRYVASITGAGWSINTGNDTIVIGVAAGAYCAVGTGSLAAVVVNTTAAATVVISDAAGSIATLKSAIAEGTYLYADIGWSGYLKIATTSTNDVTVVHTASVPTYATA